MGEKKVLTICTYCGFTNRIKLSEDLVAYLRCNKCGHNELKVCKITDQYEENKEEKKNNQK